MDAQARTRFVDGRGNRFVTTFNTWGLPESTIEPVTDAYSSLTDRTFTVGYDAAVRAQMLRMRKLMTDRYKGQIDSFIESLRAQPSLQLARQQQNTQGTAQQAQAAKAGATTPATAPATTVPPSSARRRVMVRWRTASCSLPQSAMR